MDTYKMWFGYDLTKRSQCANLDGSVFPCCLSCWSPPGKNTYNGYTYVYFQQSYMCWLNIIQVTDTYLTTPESLNWSNDWNPTTSL